MADIAFMLSPPCACCSEYRVAIARFPLTSGRLARTTQCMYKKLEQQQLMYKKKFYDSSIMPIIKASSFVVKMGSRLGT